MGVETSGRFAFGGNRLDDFCFSPKLIQREGGAGGGGVGFGHASFCDRQYPDDH